MAHPLTLNDAFLFAALATDELLDGDMRFDHDLQLDLQDIRQDVADRTFLVDSDRAVLLRRLVASARTRGLTDAFAEPTEVDAALARLGGLFPLAV
jgi:hypothetical protein